jgi:hypothetical protein
MALQDIPRGHKEKVFIAKEVSFGTPPAPFLTSSAIRLQDQITLRRTKERRILQDKSDNAAAVESSDFDCSSEWSIPESYLRPSGTLAAAPEFDTLLEALLGSKREQLVETTVSGATSPTQVTVASATNLKVGDVLHFSGGNMRTAGEVSIITAINASVLTLGIPLSAMPSNGVAVKHGITYKPVADFETSLAILRCMDNVSDICPGLWVNEGSFKFSRDDWVKASFSGSGMGKRITAGSGTAAAAGTNSTALALTVGEGRLFDFNEGPGFISIAGDPVQVVKGGGNTDTLTLAQQKSWAVGAEITPAVPVRTVVGAPVPGTRGYFYVAIGATLLVLSFESAEVTISNGFDARREAGNEYAFGFARTELKRSVTLNAQIRAKRLQQLVRYSASAGAQVGAVLQAGNVSGAIAAIVLPRLKIDADPTLEAPVNGDITMPITAVAYASAEDKDDEIAVAML